MQKSLWRKSRMQNAIREELEPDSEFNQKKGGGEALGQATQPFHHAAENRTLQPDF